MSANRFVLPPAASLRSDDHSRPTNRHRKKRRNKPPATSPQLAAAVSASATVPVPAIDLLASLDADLAAIDKATVHLTHSFDAVLHSADTDSYDLALSVFLSDAIRFRELLWPDCELPRFYATFAASLSLPHVPASPDARRLSSFESLPSPPAAPLPEPALPVPSPPSPVPCPAVFPELPPSFEFRLPDPLPAADLCDPLPVDPDLTLRNAFASLPSAASAQDFDVALTHLLALLRPRAAAFGRSTVGYPNLTNSAF